MREYDAIDVKIKLLFHITAKDIENQTILKKGSEFKEIRKRRRWTENETKILEHGIEQKKTWVEIAKLIPGRTNEMCKDKARNLKKARRN